jgi:hypothetical protein
MKIFMFKIIIYIVFSYIILRTAGSLPSPCAALCECHTRLCRRPLGSNSWNLGCSLQEVLKIVCSRFTVQHIRQNIEMSNIQEMKKMTEIKLSNCSIAKNNTHCFRFSTFRMSKHKYIL